MGTILEFVPLGILASNIKAMMKPSPTSRFLVFAILAIVTSFSVGDEDFWSTVGQTMAAHAEDGGWNSGGSGASSGAIHGFFEGIARGALDLPPAEPANPVADVHDVMEAYGLITDRSGD